MITTINSTDFLNAFRDRGRGDNFSMTNEQKSIAIRDYKKALTRQLLEARSCLKNEYRKLFTKKKVDFKYKSMLSDNGKFVLIWQVRSYPDEPESYNNQQTSQGCVELFEVNGNK